MLSKMTDGIGECMSSTEFWYERNKIEYGEIMNSRRTRPHPQPLALIGRGTIAEPFEVETEIA